jgi:exosortase
VLALLFVLCAYWPALRDVARRWANDPQYSHGYLVPLFSLALLWMRRQRGAEVTWRGNWWGPVVLGGAVVLHLTGAYVYHGWLAECSFLPALAGLCLCVGGWPLLRWAWPAVAYLAFMLPLPYRLEMFMVSPLRRVATLGSTYLLQTLGISAVAEGNLIVLDGVTLGVVDGCSGLGMLVTFVAISAAVAIVIRRPWLDKVVLFLSALPIALVANVLRITLTGALAQTVSQRLADGFHELAGWFMMPLAIGLLGIEAYLLSRLLVEPPPDVPLKVDFGGPFPGHLPRAAALSARQSATQH